MSPSLKAPLKRVVRRAPGWALRAVLRALPGSSRRWGPPRRFVTMPELAAHGGCEWREVFPARRADYPPPIARAEDLTRLRRFAPVTWAATGVARLPQARLLTEHALPVTLADEFVLDAAWNDGRPVYEAVLIGACGPIEKRPGVALNLGSTWAAINYGHFVLDALPRLELFERAGGKLGDVDWVVLPAFKGAGAQRLVQALGLPEQKIVHANRSAQLAFDAVWQPSYPCANQARCYPPWVPEFYRTRLAGPTGATGRRLYLPRGRGRRSLANEAELAPWLHAHGFEMVDLGTVSNGPELMASAEAVIAPHGAAMTDLVFCRPGTIVVELLPPNWLWPYFYSLSAAAGLRHHAVIGEPAPRDAEGRTRFRIDVRKFAEVAEAAIGGR